MKTINPKPFQVFQFSELSDDAKKVAIEQLNDINVADFDWWSYTYDDAKSIGLKITSFDLDRHQIDGVLVNTAHEICPKIIAEHGEQCGTYALAKKWLNDYMESDFLKELCGEYLTILRDEYDYLISDEAIISTIEINEYEFLESGKQYF